VSRKEQSVPNPVVHFELAGSDPKALQQFYTSLFGWSINDDNPVNYGLVDTQAGGINGGIESEARGPATTIYVAVDDLQAYLDKIEQAGGKTVTPVTEIPNMVTYATFTDPEGNVMGLVKNSM
jgi:predicted enzyme related to lactoylglutathione lyase